MTRVAAPARRRCTRCGVPRPALRSDPDACLYCGAPLLAAPVPSEPAESAPPSLFEIVEAPAVRRAGGGA